MPKYTIAPAAQRDIESILTRTHDHFGAQARLRYEALLAPAIRDVVTQPERPGSSARHDTTPVVRTYHLTHSRRRVRGVGRVKHPRHFILYRVDRDRVEIGRILHDSMDLERHLPDEYRIRGDEIGPGMP